MQSLVRKLRTLFHPRKYALKPVLSPASDRYGKEQVERSGTPLVAKTTTTVAKFFLDCKPRASTCCLNANAFGVRKFGRDLNAYDADVIGYGISTSRPIIVALEIGVEFVGVFKNNSCNPGSWKTIIAEVDDQPDRNIQQLHI